MRIGLTAGLTTIVLLLVCGFSAGAAAPAAQVRVLSLRVANAPKGLDENGLVIGSSNGVKVQVLISDPSQHFTDNDNRQSALTSFTDGKGTDLLKSTDDDSSEKHVNVGSISNDGHAFVATLSADRCPAPGAARLRIRGAIVMRCGRDPEAQTLKDTVLKTGAKLTLGNVPVTIQILEGPQKIDMPMLPVILGMLPSAAHDPATQALNSGVMGIIFRGNRPFDFIKSIRFVDDSGQTIKSHCVEIVNGLFGICTTRYSLDRAVKKVTIRLKYWGTVEPVKIPVSIDTPLGIGRAHAQTGG